MSLETGWVIGTDYKSAPATEKERRLEGERVKRRRDEWEGDRVEGKKVRGWKVDRRRVTRDTGEVLEAGVSGLI